RWLKPPSPQIPSAFDNPCRSTPVPHSPPWKGAPPEHGTPRRLEFGNQGARRPAGIQNVNGAESSRCFSAVLGKAASAVPLVESAPAAPSGIPVHEYLTYCQNVAGLWLKYGA